MLAMQALLPSNSSLLNTSSLSLSAPIVIRTCALSLCSPLSSPLNQLDMLMNSWFFSLFVPISDIHKICKWLNSPNFGKYIQITFCLCMYSWNFKLWTFCMGILYRNFVLLICLNILCGSLILFEGSVWALCVVIVWRFFVLILYWFCVFYTWIQCGFYLHILW